MERAHGVDVARLARAGALGAELASGTLRWTDGSSIGYVADAREVSVLYGVTAYGEAQRQVRAVVPVEWTPCPFGGRRPWLRCPRCSRRCATVYALASGAACRVCGRLGYLCQREALDRRAMRRGRKLVERLGVKGAEEQHWAALEPRRLEKPYRMRWATYDRLVEAAEAAELDRVAALLPGMIAWTDRLQRSVARQRR